MLGITTRTHVRALGLSIPNYDFKALMQAKVVDNTIGSRDVCQRCGRGE